MNLSDIPSTSNSSEIFSDSSSISMSDIESETSLSVDEILHNINVENNMFSPTATPKSKTIFTNQLKIKLAEWAVTSNIALVDISKLLKILVDEGNIKCLPKDARTLLETPRNAYSIRKLDNGFYVHLGVKKFLERFLQHNNIATDTIWLSFSVDGTPVSLSGANSLWPIFGALHYNSSLREIFEIGLFNGPNKPDSFNNYLSELVAELCDLTENGYTDEKTNKFYVVKIKSIVADAPALAALKYVKSHGGYSACTKCETRGTYIINNSIVYPEINAPLRTNESFRQRMSSKNDDSHHTSNEHTILEKLPIDMIKDFPLDKMHLVDEGVVKKILILLTSKVNKQKLPAKKIMIINNRLKNCAGYMPIEFQRKPRSLKYVLKMKATEYRDFLLYTGPSALKNVIPKSTYNHFMSLSLAIRILSSPLNYMKYNSYANSLLQLVVQLFPKIYGIHNVTYNVHGLIHIAADAKRHGPCDSYSCYAFEARIKKLKKMIHTQNMPLQQIFNRISENIKFQTSVITMNNVKKINLSQPSEDGSKYFKAEFPLFLIRADKKSDNCIMLKNKTILRVHYFKKDSYETAKYVFGQILVNVNPLSRENCMLLFYLVTGNFESQLTKHCLADVSCKMCCMPYDLYDAQYFVCPINHTLRE